MSADTKSDAPIGEGTRVDLGDDLLSEKTRVLPGMDPTVVSSPPSATMEDHFESAKILLAEGLPEEAKKILRQILRSDPGHVLAKKTLNEIHDLELKQIFGSEKPRRRVGEKPTQPLSVLDSQQILRQLDRDLGLGTIEQMSLFQDKAAMDKFSAGL